VVDEVEPAGWHEVSWNRRDARGTRVAAGVYLARLTAFARSRTYKLVLLP